MAEQLTINAPIMDRIYEFHAHIFEDILRVAKSAVEFAPEISLVPLLVVPLLKGTRRTAIRCVATIQAICSFRIRCEWRRCALRARHVASLAEYSRVAECAD